MNRQAHRSVFTLSLLLAAGLAGSYGWAQPQEASKEKFSQTQKKNAADLQRYGWRARTEFKVNGETRNTRVESLRYANGNLQKQVIGNTGETTALMNGLQKVAQSYGHMTADQMRGMALSAAISDGQGENAGTLLILGTNAVESQDTVGIWVDPSTFQMRRMKADTRYENETIHVTATFESLSGGPTYPARIELTYPKLAIQILIENSNYQQQVAATPQAARPRIPFEF
jgi:hypothetical protein